MHVGNTPGHVAQVYKFYCGRDGEEVRALAALYAMAVKAGGVDDGAGGGA